MLAQWTAEIVGDMHIHRIAKKRLAQYLGVTPEYVSMVLNGHREPLNAEGTFRQALDALIAEKQNTNLPPDNTSIAQ